jgi:ribosome-associated protein
MSADLDPVIAPFIQAIQGKQAQRVLILDVRGLTSIADAFILLSGRSSRQVTAVADHIRQQLKQQGRRPLSVEGERDGQWVLMDYGDVLIHLFYEPVRQFYDLEGLWADAPRIQIADTMAEAAANSADADADGP